MCSYFNDKKVLSSTTGLIVVLFISYWTYFFNYQNPAALFWDENYHIANAQKYLNAVHYMEPHPPLGKLLVAAGELLFSSNMENNQFLGTNYAKDIPKGFSMKGYRFFPALFGWLAAGLFFLVLFRIFNSFLPALAFSSLYVFDNAIIVHSRGAMLDSFLVFFLLLQILLFLDIVYEKDCLKFTYYSLFAGFGAVFAMLINVKVTGLILLLLYPAIIYNQWRNYKSLIVGLIVSVLSFCLVYFFIWWLHIYLGKNLVSELPNQGYYTQDTQYRSMVEKKESTSSIKNFFYAWKVNQFNYTQGYEKKVPKLNLCKEKENGSPPYFWPIGARSISYRWKKDNDVEFRYLYLQANPVIWFLAFGGVILSSSIVLCSVFFRFSKPLKNPYLICVFLGLYLAYMASVIRIDRVLYLYHYFLPLIFSFILLALVYLEVEEFLSFKISEIYKKFFLVLSAVFIIFAFYLYSPLTYYLPITKNQMEKLSLVPLWDLRCAYCARRENLAFPIVEQKEAAKEDFVDLKLDGLSPSFGSQSWGTPKLNKTATDQPLVVMGTNYSSGFGVHAKSLIRYELKKPYSRFTAFAALPDYLKTEGGTVIFRVLVDNVEKWRSSIIKPEVEPEHVDVSLSRAKTLELIAEDAGDDINNDHALWLEPRLE